MRKIIIGTFITLQLVFLSSLLKAQALSDTVIYFNNIEKITLKLPNSIYGVVQWQDYNETSKTWEDLTDEKGFNLQYSSNVQKQLRAYVVAGTCDTLFSSITKLKTLTLRLDSVTNLTDSSAHLHSYVDLKNISINEIGLLYSNRQLFDKNVQKINYSFPNQIDTFHSNLFSLNAGTQYYAKAFVKTSDGVIINSNVLSFIPVKVNISNRQNITTATIQLVYNVLGIDFQNIQEHGILVNTIPSSIQTSVKFTGNIINKNYTATALNLNSGTNYYIQAYVKSGNKIFYSHEEKVITWSDYTDPVNNNPFTINHKIDWNNPSTAKKISSDGTFGDYGRVERIGTTDTLLLVYHGGPKDDDWLNIYLRKSFNNGDTWEPQETIMDLSQYANAYWRFVNPEILSLQNGWIMVAFEANARPDENQSSIQILISKDAARTWSDPLVYKTGRSWEPAMVQLPNGEIELFFSSEAKWWPNDPIYQDIQMISSTNNGLAWSDPQIVAYYPQKRDGMPVPLLLQGNKGMVFTIETVNSGTSPYIIYRPLNEQWTLTTSNFGNSTYRWSVGGFSGHGGAPYILQLPTGETVLSAHIYRGGDWHQNNTQEVVVGDNSAKNFEERTNPWGTIPWGEGAVNNSLFLKDANTIVTISTRMLTNGQSGVYWLEGQIVPK